MVDSPTHYKNKVSQLISWGHWFSFFNIIVAMLLGTSYIFNSGWPETFAGQVYQTLSWVGHFSFLVFVVYLLIIFPLSFVITSQKLMRFIAVVVATLGFSGLMLDIYVYKNLHLHLNPAVWELLINSQSGDKSTDWQHFFVIVPALFFLELFISEWVWYRRRALSRKRLGQHIALVFTLCFFSSHLIYIWADAFIYSPITAQRSNFPLSYPMTAKTFMEKYGLLDRKEYQARQEAVGEQPSNVLSYPLSPISYSANANQFKPNLLIVMLDGLRADMLNDEVMPNLSAFAKQNLNFANHYSSSNDETVGVWSLFYGLPGNYVGSARTEGLSPLLIDSLANKNYHFNLVSSDNFQTPIYYQSIFGKHLKKAVTIDALPLWQADAQSVATAIALMQDKAASPWFTYLNLKTIPQYDQNADYAEPFQPVLDNTASLNAETAVKLKNSYQNAVHYTDALLGELINALKASDEFANTVVIITSNHGMEFNETGTNSWGENSNYSKYQLQVPMVVHWPNQAAQEYSMPSSHLDLVPTLMESMLGVDSPANQYSSGVNLFDLLTSPRKWVLAGDSRDIVIVQADKTVVVDKFGNYKVYDRHYQEVPEVKPPFSVFMNAINELKRFYKSDSRSN